MQTVWVVRNKDTGVYWSAGTSASSAPTVYLSKGKAAGRAKQLHPVGVWVVKRWDVQESDE